MNSRRVMGTVLVLFFIFLTGCNSDSTESKLHESSNLCPKNTELLSKDFEGKVVCQLKGVYVDDLHLSRDKFWAIKGEVHIGVDTYKPAILRIDEGTTIFGKTGNDYLLITRGSKIFANGTQKSPIIFTSMKDVAGLISKAGDWGGLAIAGFAPTNAGKEEKFEFSNTTALFGGEDENDNSGVLKYVQIRYAGNEVRPGEEINGLSLGGVGRGTVIDYLEVYHGKDDGIEAWGGTVNMRHLVLIGNGDDNLDLDHGYRGKIEYLYIRQEAESSLHARAIESDNNKEYFDAIPRTNALISHFEILGSDKTNEAIYSRRGSAMELYDGVIHHAKGYGIVVRSDNELRFENNHFTNIYIDHCKGDGVKDMQSNTKELEAFNQYFDSSILLGAYDKKSDWKAKWSKMN